jgi:hypothetical protein
MIRIDFKNRLLAIIIAIILSLLATLGFLFSVFNFSKSTTGLTNIKPDKTIVSVELFSPLVASVSRLKPLSSFSAISSFLNQFLNLLSNQQLPDNFLKLLTSGKIHSVIHFTNDGGIVLVTERDNNIEAIATTSPVFANSTTVENYIIYSNDKNLLLSTSSRVDNEQNFFISFNDLAKINISSDLFGADQKLTAGLSAIKNALEPLEIKDAALSAIIQQTNHRTRVHLKNFDQTINEQSVGEIDQLLYYLPKNTNTGFIVTNKQDFQSLSNYIVNKPLIADLPVNNQPILYASDKNNHWLTAINNEDEKTATQLVAAFSNYYDSKIIYNKLPDNSYAKEFVINGLKQIIWQENAIKINDWQIKNNSDNSLALATNKKVTIVGDYGFVYQLLINGGYYPKDCQTRALTKVFIGHYGNDQFYYSESSNKEAFFCLFN